MENEKVIVLPARCFRCGTELTIDGNDEWGDEDANRFYYTCPCCGDTYEECELPDSEKHNFKFWKENERDISISDNEEAHDI